jgi:hypothetical protein
MFDFVGRNKRVAQVILAIIALPFAFFGVDSYIRRMETGEQDVARVGGDKISRAEFDAALREQQERLRASMRDRYDPSMLDTPEARFNILEQLVNQRLLGQVSQKQNIVVSDEVIRAFIYDFPAFQEDGKFSPEKARTLLAARGMTEAMLEQQMAASSSVPAAAGSVRPGAFVSRTAPSSTCGSTSSSARSRRRRSTSSPTWRSRSPDERGQGALRAQRDGVPGARAGEARDADAGDGLADGEGDRRGPRKSRQATTATWPSYSDPEQRQAATSSSR